MNASEIEQRLKELEAEMAVRKAKEELVDFRLRRLEGFADHVSHTIDNMYGLFQQVSAYLTRLRTLVEAMGK